MVQRQIGSDRVCRVFGNRIAHRAVAAQPLVEHARERRDADIDVVVDPGLMFAGMAAIRSLKYVLAMVNPGCVELQVSAVAEGVPSPAPERALR